MSFADRLSKRILSKDSRIVVGIDPIPDRFPTSLFAGATHHNQSTIATALHAFGRLVLESVEPFACAVKFQIAFYEQWGIPGLQALQQTISEAADSDLLLILDAKRGDIGHTAQAYAAAYLSGPRFHDRHYPPPWKIDALTINPYLGEDSMEPLVQAAAEHDKGLFVLVKTSNPGSHTIQDIVIGEKGSIAEHVASVVSRMGYDKQGEFGYSPVGAVIGATFPDRLVKLRKLLPHAYLLLPGYGAQGAGAEDIMGAFDDNGLGAVVSASRSVIYASDATPSASAAGKAIAGAARRFRDEVNHHLQ